jgi:hypothetical protein
MWKERDDERGVERVPAKPRLRDDELRALEFCPLVVRDAVLVLLDALLVLDFGLHGFADALCVGRGVLALGLQMCAEPPDGCSP